MAAKWNEHPAFAEPLTRGQRAADMMRNTMGSWAFVISFLAFMGAWAVVNSVFYLFGKHGHHGFDPYPYILLNLMLSMLAGLQGAILLIAAKRQDAISTALALHDDKLLTKNTKLTEEIHENTRLLHELMTKVNKVPEIKQVPARKAPVKKTPAKKST